jgi:hypothetical protein
MGRTRSEYESSGRRNLQHRMAPCREKANPECWPFRYTVESCAERPSPHQRDCMRTRPIMAITKKPAQTYNVDQRVSIGMDALDETQKRAVGEVIVDRDHFLAHASDPQKVETISKRGSVYSLSVPAGLKIIYKMSGEGIEVLDLMGKEILGKYGAKKQVAPNMPLKTPRKLKGPV